MTTTTAKTYDKHGNVTEGGFTYLSRGYHNVHPELDQHPDTDREMTECEDDTCECHEMITTDANSFVWAWNPEAFNEWEEPNGAYITCTDQWFVTMAHRSDPRFSVSTVVTAAGERSAVKRAVRLSDPEFIKNNDLILVATKV